MINTHTNRYLPLAFLLFVMLFSACSRDESPAVNQKDEKGKKHGKWVEQYPDGDLKSETFYRHGIKTGTEKTYFDNGNPEVVAVWKYDSTGAMLDGPYFHYYDNGRPLLRSTYVEGEPHDTIVQYYRSGVVDYHGRYDTGKTVGKWYYYNQDGTLQLMIDHTKHQRKHYEELRAGTYHWFDSTGNVVYKATYMKGMMVNDTILQQEQYQKMIEKDDIKKGRKPL